MIAKETHILISSPAHRENKRNVTPVLGPTASKAQWSSKTHPNSSVAKHYCKHHSKEARECRKRLCSPVLQQSRSFFPLLRFVSAKFRAVGIFLNKENRSNFEFWQQLETKSQKMRRHKGR